MLESTKSGWKQVSRTKGLLKKTKITDGGWNDRWRFSNSLITMTCVCIHQHCDRETPTLVRAKNEHTRNREALGVHWKVDIKALLRHYSILQVRYLNPQQITFCSALIDNILKRLYLLKNNIFFGVDGTPGEALKLGGVELWSPIHTSSSMCGGRWTFHTFQSQCR